MTITPDTATAAHDGALIDATIDTDGVVHIVARGGDLALPIVATGGRTADDVAGNRAVLEHLRDTLDALLDCTEADLQVMRRTPAASTE